MNRRVKFGVQDKDAVEILDYPRPKPPLAVIFGMLSGRGASVEMNSSFGASTPLQAFGMWLAGSNASSTDILSQAAQQVCHFILKNWNTSIT